MAHVARHRSLGTFLLEAVYPRFLVGFAAPQVRPSPMIFAMLADYSDFDLRPPSVRFVDPFTTEPLKAREMPSLMVRRVTAPADAPVVVQAAGGQPLQMPAAFAAAMPLELRAQLAVQPLLQAYGADDVPFLCLAGVREYHEHPGHSGDPWELHRPAGAGSLARIIEVVRTYAVEPIQGYDVTLVPQVRIMYGDPPA